ncbi:hypothetical protein TNCV_1209341 [Trichonephila clavipes]|nr:hypothetical protein TNCV_1209341 [Trichonephila clavipes]
MSDLSDFQTGLIVGAPLTRESVTETFRLLGISRGDGVFHDDNAPILAARLVRSCPLGRRCTSSSVRTTSGSRFPQSPVRPPTMLLSPHLMIQNGVPEMFFIRGNCCQQSRDNVLGHSSSVRMLWQLVFEKYVVSAICASVWQRFFRTHSDTNAIFSAFREVEGHPTRSLSSMDSWTSLQHRCHS